METLSTKRGLKWIQVFHHLQMVNSIFLVGIFFIGNYYWSTILFAVALILVGVLGVTAGSHRLWAHRSYEASTGLRVFLMLCQTTVSHGSIYNWVRWHRLHHKHFGTDLDPYNPSRGFFYSHLGCLLFELSPAQKKALSDIDMSDIEEDKVVMFQKKYYIPLLLIFGYLLPINAPAQYWGESMMYSVFAVWWFKAGITLHICNAIHSATNIWGLNPGEKYPCDTNMVFILSKTNWLSYHYLAPWDYQTSEFGKYGTDCVTKFIQICQVLGHATGLRTVESTMVREALTNSLKEKKTVSNCLLELETEKLKKNVFASKFY